MTPADFYSDRTSGPVPRLKEEVTRRVWQGLVTLITRRIDDGSLAREFPVRDCADFRDAITGTDRERFEIQLSCLIPRLQQESPAVPGVKTPFNIYSEPSTPVALDVVEFVGWNIAEPSERISHRYFQHEHIAFDRFSTHKGQERFRKNVESIFARNGLAFTVHEDMRIGRLGPAEARPLLADFSPNTGDAKLDAILRTATTRFLSRDSHDRVDALKDLWDAFERMKTLELGGQNKKASAVQLIRRAVPDSLFKSNLETEFKELTNIGNDFQIRHFEHGKSPLPTPMEPVLDYLFTRLAALIAYILRQTGRM